MKNKASVYLAGPDVFIVSSDIGNKKKELCQQHGFAPLYPLDNEISGNDASTKIYQANCEMIERADYVLANISPFRGPHCDVGTAFEIGYAISQNKKVITYSNDARELIERIREDYKEQFSSGFHVEDFGLTENLMISAIYSSICVDDRQDLSAWTAFEKAVQTLSKQFCS